MRRDASRLLLLVLAVLVVALVVRQCAGRGGARGQVVVAEDVGAGELRHEAFRLIRPARLAVEAVGSFETDSALAVYGWIVRREDRAVVWQMTPANVERGRGTLATAVDTLALEAGTYDAYFTTHGDPFLPVAGEGTIGERVLEFFRVGGRAWRSDASRWHFGLGPAGPADAGALEVLHGPEQDAAPSGPGLLWAGGPARPGQDFAFTFVVRAPTEVQLEATGEFASEPVDVGWIEDLATGRRVWEMTAENTEPAGGSLRNRRFRGRVALQPGLYRAAFESDYSHGFGSWTANPPLDPAAHGLFLYAAPGAAIAAFDPWDGLPRIVEMTRIGNDALDVATFTLTDSLRAWIYTTGEVLGGTAYDRAWLLRDGAVVWDMADVETRPAGGADKNRVAEAYLALPPGAYALHYKTDDSHAYGSWNARAPDHPERWGVALFALAPEAPAIAVTREHGGAVPPPEFPAEAAGPVALPLRLAPLGNDQEVRRMFVLEDVTPVRIYAVGELLRTQRPDYGWITRANTDEVVWEMTRDNTRPAGGTSKNRLFDGVLTLAPGAYTVHFVTDGSHAYGDFSQGSPDDPSAWGIMVEPVDYPAPPPPPAPPDLSDQAEMEALAREAARMAEEVRRSAREQLEATRQRDGQ